MGISGVPPVGGGFTYPSGPNDNPLFTQIAQQLMQYITKSPPDLNSLNVMINALTPLFENCNCSAQLKAAMEKLINDAGAKAPSSELLNDLKNLSSDLSQSGPITFPTHQDAVTYLGEALQSLFDGLTDNTSADGGTMMSDFASIVQTFDPNAAESIEYLQEGSQAWLLTPEAAIAAIALAKLFL